jgi:hypothetical protein
MLDLGHCGQTSSSGEGDSRQKKEVMKANGRESDKKGHASDVFGNRRALLFDKPLQNPRDLRATAPNVSAMVVSSTARHEDRARSIVCAHGAPYGFLHRYGSNVNVISSTEKSCVGRSGRGRGSGEIEVEPLRSDKRRHRTGHQGT